MFETTIRVLGGLLSGHMLIEKDPSLAPNYDGTFLAMAKGASNVYGCHSAISQSTCMLGQAHVWWMAHTGDSCLMTKLGLGFF